MTRPRPLATTMTPAVAVLLLGMPRSASAACTGKKTTVARVSTVTVAAPANVSTAGSDCAGSQLDVHRTWRGSPTPEVASHVTYRRTVTAITDHGWSAESPRTGALSC